MLYWAVVFGCIAMVAAALGFSGLVGSATTAALVLFWVFLGLSQLTLVLGLAAR